MLRKIVISFLNSDVSVMVLFLVIGFWQFERVDGYVIEDAYIGIRYVQNFLEGNGWVFNIGENYNAITSPLHLMLMTLLGEVFGAYYLPVLYYLVSCIGIWVSSIFLYFLLKKYSRMIGFALGVGLLLGPRIYDGMGIETSINLMFFLMLMYSIQNTKFGLGAFCLGILPLIRLENIIVYPFIFGALYLYHVDRKNMVRNWTVILLPLIIWHIFSYIYFGSLLPETLSAKMWQGESGRWGDGFVYFADMWKYFSSGLFPLGHTAIWQIALVSILSVFGLVSVFKSRSVEFLILAIFTMMHTCIYGFIFNVPGYYWYFVWVYVLLLITSGLGLKYMCEAFFKKFWTQKIVISGGCLIFLSCLGVSVLRSEFSHGPIREYRELGTWIAENLPEDAIILHDEVGTIAFYSRRYMVDTLGLLSPQYMKNLEQGQVGFFWNFIFNERHVNEMYYVTRRTEEIFAGKDENKNLMYSDGGLILMKLERGMFELPIVGQFSLFEFDYTTDVGVGQKSINLLPSGKVCPSFLLPTDGSGVHFTAVQRESKTLQLYSVREKSDLHRGDVDLQVKIEFTDGFIVQGQVLSTITDENSRNYAFHIIRVDENRLIKNMSIIALDNGIENDRIGICNPVVTVENPTL